MGIRRYVGKGIAYAGLAALLYSPIGCMQQARVSDYSPADLSKARAQLEKSPLEEYVLDRGEVKKTAQRKPNRNPAEFWKHMDAGAKKCNVGVKDFAYRYMMHLQKEMWTAFGKVAEATRDKDYQTLRQKRTELHRLQDQARWSIGLYRQRYLRG